MTLETFFQKKSQLKISHTWLQAMQTREVQKNNFHATGDLKKAHAFAQALKLQTEKPIQSVEVHFEQEVQPIVIYSRIAA